MRRDLFGNESPRGRFGDDIAPIEGPTLDLVLHHETDKAILVSPDGREANAQWLAKSRCEFTRGALDTRAIKRTGRIVRLPVITVTLTEPLAKEKGLI